MSLPVHLHLNVAAVYHLSERCHCGFIFFYTHSCMEPDILGVSHITDDAYRNIRMAGRPDFCPVELYQRRSRADLLSFLHQIFKSIPIHAYRVNSNMQQDFHAVFQL